MGHPREDQIVEAIAGYDYPAVTYDFRSGRERAFSRMVDLDCYLHELLVGGHPDKIKEGLSAVLYWGHYCAPHRDFRVTRFRTEITGGKTVKGGAFARQYGPAFSGRRVIRKDKC